MSGATEALKRARGATGRAAHQRSRAKTKWSRAHPNSKPAFPEQPRRSATRHGTTRHPPLKASFFPHDAGRPIHEYLAPAHKIEAGTSNGCGTGRARSYAIEGAASPTPLHGPRLHAYMTAQTGGPGDCTPRVPSGAEGVVQPICLNNEGRGRHPSVVKGARPRPKIATEGRGRRRNSKLEEDAAKSAAHHPVRK